MTQRVAVVTGAQGGLGESMCKALCQQDRQVVGSYLPGQEAEAKQWQSTMKEAGFDVAVYPLDVTDYDHCCTFISKVEEEVGPIDILVNNAGITRDGPLKRLQPEQWRAVIQTNLDSMYNMSQPMFEAMCNRGFGRIVNISSLNGEKGQFGQANYSAAKAGIYGFTKAIALEGARKGVTVNAVSPGYIDTPMVRQVPENVLNAIVEGIPVGRLGQPEEIARAVTFLTADDAGFITGTNLSVNGGQYMS
ncbi:acetoacetyl-CoA reductase [Neptuniibacter caesariensis]|uniref:Acetoacetyl-CoA reductase n=1 Tax=Neptuniibacter caesariensis TaxID=207954 RepID=A0A7U8C8U8_NEPCE|nr:acetoacetyl-CoA reductase [Neptuniibacter caesariensis]EAR62701.1 acetoacetyl-CoA reductase [Oceanospirillum sp. MED92] [Neptuniibacter caesariensis]